MTPEEIQAMAKGLAEGQVLWYLLSAIIGGAITGLGAYLADKGKNRATKEDIAAITHEVEKVRDEFVRGIEDLKAHHQLRMLAAERRMQAHQEAYVWWQKLWRSTVTEKKDELDLQIEGFRSWYFENCIFLSKKTRLACIETIGSSLSYFGLIACRPEINYPLINQTLAKLENAAAIIMSEVDLPPIKADEIRAQEELLNIAPR